MIEDDELLSVVRQWVQKAENDLKNAAYTLRMGKDCPTDTVCFHAQQCAEKYLKALLVLQGLDFPRTHDMSQSDTPGKAGGLMSGTASKAVGYCEKAKNALLHRRLPAPEYRPGLVPTQSLPSRPHTHGPRNAPPQNCDLVQQTAGRWQWHFCPSDTQSPTPPRTWAVSQCRCARDQASNGLQ